MDAFPRREARLVQQIQRSVTVWHLSKHYPCIYKEINKHRFLSNVCWTARRKLQEKSHRGTFPSAVQFLDTIHPWLSLAHLEANGTQLRLWEGRNVSPSHRNSNQQEWTEPPLADPHKVMLLFTRPPVKSRRPHLIQCLLQKNLSSESKQKICHPEV